MDAQQTYLLNGLLVRQFSVGRVVRFRQAPRGRQAETFELFTAEEHEFLVHLFPRDYSADQLNFAATAVNILDQHRFTVVPFQRSKEGTFAAEGPQNSRMMVSLAPAGTSLAAAQYSEHAISQVGLRLAWMHRLLKEQLSEPRGDMGTPASRFAALYEDQPSLPKSVATSTLERLRSLLNLRPAQGWVHGDIQALALLHDSDQQLRTLTDWGMLHYGCPLEDVVDAFLFLATTPAGTLDASRAGVLMEAYDSLVPIRRVPWTPVVASWCAQRMVDHKMHHREPPAGFYEGVLPEPERLATALAGSF